MQFEAVFSPKNGYFEGFLGRFASYNVYCMTMLCNAQITSKTACLFLAGGLFGSFWHTCGVHLIHWSSRLSSAYCPLPMYTAVQMRRTTTITSEQQYHDH